MGQKIKIKKKKYWRKIKTKALPDNENKSLWQRIKNIFSK